MVKREKIQKSKNQKNQNIETSKNRKSRISRNTVDIYRWLSGWLLGWSRRQPQAGRSHEERNWRYSAWNTQDRDIRSKCVDQPFQSTYNEVDVSSSKCLEEHNSLWSLG